ncbi:uncharacterized protein LOC127284973 [Leptopilina boulardi]|uniref:uncharacterized protein LOC127284973 n=1 Tax=Leptopilina boulardi TaxID=63433 RepID=UPI0021F5A18F|nr:uncharacterized protein LOC127284973 [Leptopilina boulardi]
MNAPYLVEESSLVQLAPNLENLVKSLPNNATQNDYLITVVIVVLAETGFFIPSDNDQERCSIKSLRIPQNWKSVDGIYRITFQYNIGRDFTCKLVAIPIGDKVILNFSSQSLRCLVSQTLKYINPHSSEISGKFWNLKEFSFRLKNEVLTPLRVELLTTFGLPSPSLFGLPEEVKVYILRMLDSKSKRNLFLCCPHFSDISSRRR